mgnify:CR=1 FL=1
MGYIKVSEAAEKWGISPRRVRKLCEENRIEGVIRKGKLYMIPKDASKPADRRISRRNFTAVFDDIDRKLKELSSMRPLTEGEVQRLREQFLIEYTYNSNAIEGNTLTLQETAMVLQGITIDQKPLKDHLEAIGHKEAFLYELSLLLALVLFILSAAKNSFMEIISPEASPSALRLSLILSTSDFIKSTPDKSKSDSSEKFSNLGFSSRR